MSLLPSPDTAKSILPYNMAFNSYNPGYLFDLSTDTEAAARTVKVFCGSAISGAGRDNKKMFNSEVGLPELERLYGSHQYAHTLLEAAANDLAFGTRGLDALGAHYDQLTLVPPKYLVWSHERPKKILKDCMQLNELFVAADTSHIAAIVLPVMDTPESQLLAELAGALAGYEHANKGMNIPVVYYQVTGPRQGTCSFFAQGKEECRQKAIEAIDKLQKNSRFAFALQWVREAHTNYPGQHYFYRESLDTSVEQLQKEAMLLLGIDMLTPLASQHVELPAAGRSPHN